MRIDKKIEKATREMLSTASRGELEELEKIIRGIGNGEQFLECLGLCMRIAGYVAVDVMGPEWPTEAGLRRMAENAASSDDIYDFSADEIYNFLRNGAVGFQSLDQVFPNQEEMAVAPITMTAGLLLSFCPRGQQIGEYLNDIEDAIELAESVKPSSLPAMILRAHRDEASKAR